MAKKEFAVFGLGEFGSSIAITLEESAEIKNFPNILPKIR